MPSLRQTSATVTPLSACCNANTICDSVNLDFFMAIVRLPSCHKLPAFLYFILVGFFGRRSLMSLKRCVALTTTGKRCKNRGKLTQEGLCFRHSKSLQRHNATAL